MIFSEELYRPRITVQLVSQEVLQNDWESSPDGLKARRLLFFSEFVEVVFVPQRLSSMRLSGRDHFQAVLKHILTPERVNKIFQRDSNDSRARLSAIPGWPYIDELRLCDVSGENIQQIVTIASQRGYSSQTVTHIRNVLSAIFSYAKKLQYFVGENPTRNVVLPKMVRKEAHSLTLAQLSEVVRYLRYPEREAALLAALMHLNVSEICGLQWKNVNLSDSRRMVDREWVPPRSIFVRTQHYRCQLGPVQDDRKRIVKIPDVLCSFLDNVKDYRSIISPEEFVFSTRNGNPICPCNVVARRFNVVANKLGLSRLNWQVFRRTYPGLIAEFGPGFNAALKKALPIERTIFKASRRPREARDLLRKIHP